MTEYGAQLSLFKYVMFSWELTQDSFLEYLARYDALDKLSTGIDELMKGPFSHLG